MFTFSDILPFTSLPFFTYMAAVILLFLLAKALPAKWIPYRWLLAFSSAFYLFVLFPKPLQLLALLAYSYGIYYFLGRKLKVQGLLLPVLLLVLPLVLMKLTNVLPAAEDGKGLQGVMALLWQVAGLSYITFRVVQLYIDEKDAPGTVSPLRFFNFTTFVPTLLIGPIDRLQRFDTDVQKGYAGISMPVFLEGLDYFVRGLLYKFIIAEIINQALLLRLVNDGSLLFHAAYMYTYLFYLFFDFAGYSLLAMGFGHMIGIRVPYNFNRPFTSINPKEFWQRWHKTLGDWLNDYFFKPVFKELTTKKMFKPIQRQNLALFFTFTLMGFWNGFRVHYIMSGMLFGLYSVIHNYYTYLCKKNGRDVFFGKLPATAVKYISIFILFNAVAFAIYIFSGELIKI
ncbi:MAG: MBOAT family O-acyltransferase [Flavobacteriales bacterium]